MKWCLILLILSCTVSCGSNSTQNDNKTSAEPSPSVSTSQVNTPKGPFPNEEEEDPLDDEESRRDESERLRAEVRENAIEYAQQNFPGWKVKGVITRQTFDKHYQVTLDLEKGSQTKTLQLILRRFFSESGEPYWKAEVFVAQNLSRQYQELAYLRFVEGQRYSYDVCKELVLDNLDADEVPDSVQESIIESYVDRADYENYEPADPHY
ncbi:MAG: hypothetical protein ACR2G4_12560 [Pyrinomonadaceae bacterium]